MITITILAVDQALKQDIPSSLLHLMRFFKKVLTDTISSTDWRNTFAMCWFVKTHRPRTYEVGDTIKTKYVEQSQNCDQDFILGALKYVTNVTYNTKRETKDYL